MAPSAVTAVKDLGRSGLQSARRTACRCGRRVVATVLPPPRTPDDGEGGGKMRSSALEGRWSLTALPKASTPPNPLLPSEIKYSASLVRGQAVTHAVLGTLLFIMGVLGTRHTGGGGTSSAGVWCGVAAIVCSVCGLMANRLWYRNWAIKSFMLASTAAVVLCVLGIGLTSYFAVLASYQASYHHEPTGGYSYGSDDSEAAASGVNSSAETSSEIKDVYFDLPPPPRPSQSLLGNLIVGLCAELLVSVWSLVIAWRGVQAEEFTVSRREEMVKEIIAKTPASHALSRTTTVDAETNGSMPLAALYNLLQAHPELMTSKLQWGTECSHAPSSHASMDYRERVSRYLSNTLQPDDDTERNPSPSSITSLTRRQRSSSAPNKEDHEAHRHGTETSCRRSRSKSEHRTKNKERRRKTKEAEVTEGGYSSSASSPTNSSTSPPETPSDSSPSSTLTRLESSDTSDTLDMKIIAEEEGKQSQSLVLGLKTLSPLSSHVISPSEMMPSRKGKFATIQSKTTANVENELMKVTASVETELAKSLSNVEDECATVDSKKPTREESEIVKPTVNIESDSEYNVSFVHTADKPPPLPRKEYGKPTLVINEKLRQEADYMNREQVSANTKSSPAATVTANDTDAAQFHKQNLLKELADRNEKRSASQSSKASVVSEKSNTNTLLRRKKDKKSPPVPDKLHPVDKAKVPKPDRQDDPHQNLGENNNHTNRKEVDEKYAEIELSDRIYSNLNDVTCDNTNAIADNNEIYVNVPVGNSRDLTGSRKESDGRFCKQPLSIEIRPYATKTIVIKRDDRGKESV